MTKQYWLFKTEPGCFSIDHLVSSPGQTAAWSGVRNYQARNILRDNIQVGDEVLFYHSSVEPAGIAGTCTVVRSGYPDHTAQHPGDEHYDPKASPSNPIWYMVDVKFKAKLDRILPLSVLKRTPGLERMVVCQRGSRLSIQPVTVEEWKVISRLMRSYR